MVEKNHLIVLLSLFLLILPCSGVINNLDEKQYALMPPLFELDEYEPCLSREGGRYCLLRLDLFDEGGSPLMNMINEYSENTIKHYNHSIIERGVCVQKKCAEYADDHSNTTEGLKRALGVCLNESIWQEYGVQAHVTVYYCDTNGESESITTSDWTVLLAFSVVIIVNLVATLYDYTLNYYNTDGVVIGNNYFLSFSMIRNYGWLTSSQPVHPKLKSLQFIHFIRVLTNFLMILAHAMLIIGNYTINSHDFEKTYEHVFYQLVYNGMMIVQIFFFVSGFLLLYNFQLYSGPIAGKFVPFLMFLRFCRLGPALAVVLAFSSTWLRHLGSGPLWKLFITNSVVADCRSYWWHHLLFLNNYVPEDKFCAIPTWHIAADSQIYLVALIVLVSTRNRDRRWLTVIILAAATVLPAIQTWWQDLDAVVIMSPEFYRTLESSTFRNVHVGGQNNVQCFVIGMIAAYLVHHYQNKGVDLSKSKLSSVICWLCPPAVAVWFYCGHVFYSDGQRESLAVRLLYAGGHRLVIGLIAVVFTLSMTLKTPSRFRTIAEWSGWRVPSRLSYSVYLLHMNLVHILMASRTELSTVSFFTVAKVHFGVALASYAIAVPFFLMVEAPLNCLAKAILDNKEEISEEQVFKKID